VATRRTHVIRARSRQYDSRSRPTGPNLELQARIIQAFLGPFSFELGDLVICADSYDAPLPEDGLRWWAQLWKNMTSQSWIAGNSRFFSVLRCRHYTKYWPSPAEVYRGDLNHTLKTPVLLIAETYDPATPLRNGRRLLEEMGQNGRLVVHHGYGHSSRWDRSDCTDDIGKAYILNGTLPGVKETECYPNSKPYIKAVPGDENEMHQ
jgi:pimeloyl-ACP methyl ester carboxylesterase